MSILQRNLQASDIPDSKALVVPEAVVWSSLSLFWELILLSQCLLKLPRALIQVITRPVLRTRLKRNLLCPVMPASTTMITPREQKGIYGDLSRSFSGGFIAEQHWIDKNILTGWIDAKTTCAVGNNRVYYFLELVAKFSWQDLCDHKLQVALSNEK